MIDIMMLFDKLFWIVVGFIIGGITMTLIVCNNSCTHDWLIVHDEETKSHLIRMGKCKKCEKIHVIKL